MITKEFDFAARITAAAEAHREALRLQQEQEQRQAQVRQEKVAEALTYADGLRQGLVALKEAPGSKFTFGTHTFDRQGFELQIRLNIMRDDNQLREAFIYVALGDADRSVKKGFYFAVDHASDPMEPSKPGKNVKPTEDPVRVFEEVLDRALRQKLIPA